MLKQSKYLRISVVNTCNLSCFFCHNEGADITGEKLSIDALEFACQIAKKEGFNKFKLSGGEPTIRKDIIQLVKRLSAIGLEDFSMITNGVLLEDFAEPLRKSGLQRINVSLHTLNQAKFEGMMVNNKVRIDKIIRGIDRAIDVGYTDMKINFVYTGPDSDQELNDMLDFVAQRSITLVVLPVIRMNTNVDSTIQLNELYEKFKEFGIQHEKMFTDNEGINKRLILLKSGAKVLLRKDELSARKPYHFCDNCSFKVKCKEGIFPLRLSASGELIPCLASNQNRISIRDALENMNENAVVNAIHRIQGGNRTEIAQ